MTNDLIALSLLILRIGDTKVWLTGWGLIAFLVIAGAAASK